MTRRTLLQRRLGDERGQVLMLFVVVLVVLLGIAAIALDVGRAYVAQRQLRAVADAASVAAANDLPVVSATCTTLPAAWSYSASTASGPCPGGKNVINTLPGVQTTVSLSCLSQYVSSGTAPPCRTASGGGPTQNAVTVTETASIPLTFGKVLPGLLFGQPSWTVKASSTSLMHGGAPHPADIMIVLDRTGSMGQSCTAGGTKIGCAKAGVDAFLSQMLPYQQDGTTVEDEIAFETFPPVNIAATGNYYANAFTKACTSGQTAYYDNGQNGATLAQKATNPNWAYVITPLSNDFRTSNASGLNPNSNIVKLMNGGTGCANGLQLPTDPEGTTYADAIEIAQQYLAANGRPNAQDVIVFLSDGEANYGPVYHSNSGGTITAASETADTYRTTPCHQAINSSRNATNSGDWIYTIAYAVGDSSNSPACTGWKNGGSSCVAVVTQFSGSCVQNENPAITAFATMQNMASDGGKFFFDPTADSLVAYFQAVAASISTPRIVFIPGPDNSG